MRSIKIFCSATRRTFSGERPCENEARYVLPDNTLRCGLCELDVGGGTNISRNEELDGAIRSVVHATDEFLWETFPAVLADAMDDVKRRRER